MKSDKFQNPVDLVEVLPGIAMDLNESDTEALSYGWASGTQSGWPAEEDERDPINLDDLNFSGVCEKAKALQARLLFLNHAVEHFFNSNSTAQAKASAFIDSMEDDVWFAAGELFKAISDLNVVGDRLIGDVTRITAVSILLSLTEKWNEARSIERLDVAIAQLEHPVRRPDVPISTIKDQWVNPLRFDLDNGKVFRKDTKKEIHLSAIACEILRVIADAKGHRVTVKEMGDRGVGLLSKDYVREIISTEIRHHFDEAIIESKPGPGGGYSLVSLNEVSRRKLNTPH